MPSQKPPSFDSEFLSESSIQSETILTKNIKENLKNIDDLEDPVPSEEINVKIHNFNFSVSSGADNSEL